MFFLDHLRPNKPGANLSLLFLSTIKIGLALFLLWIAGILALRFKIFPAGAGAWPAFYHIPFYFLFQVMSRGRSSPGRSFVHDAVRTSFHGDFFQKKGNWTAAAPFAIVSAWAVFSLLMLAKILLNARIYQYGFSLALPATLMAVWMLVHFFLPCFLRSRRGRDYSNTWLLQW